MGAAQTCQAVPASKQPGAIENLTEHERRHGVVTCVGTSGLIVSASLARAERSPDARHQNHERAPA